MTAEFHICTKCGVAPVVTSEIEGRLYAAVNVNAFDNVEPSRLRRGSPAFRDDPVEARLARRKKYWIANVEYDAP